MLRRGQKPSMLLYSLEEIMLGWEFFLQYESVASDDNLGILQVEIWSQ